MAIKLLIAISFFFSPIACSQCDLVVFSHNRPMQLFAFLESLEKLTKNVRKIAVLARIDDIYEPGYQIVHQRFPHAQFIRQSNLHFKTDFKPLLEDLLFGPFGDGAEYIVFAVDDIIITDSIDFEEGMKKLEQTKGYGLYYRLGKNIDYCFMQQSHQGIPSLLDVGDGYFSWQFYSGLGDWGYPNSVDLTLYPKKAIQDGILAAQFSGPTQFEGHWAADKQHFGICYQQSKMVNIPMNTVAAIGFTGRRATSALNLNRLFVIEGLKIDIAPLYHISNNSPHIDYEVKFIPR